MTPLSIPQPTVPIPAGPHDDRRFAIDGHALGFPTEFAAGQSMMGLFLVPVGALNRRIAPSGFAAAEVAPRRGVVTVVCVHYTDTQCGVYEEICWGCFVQPVTGARNWPGSLARAVRGELPSYTWRLAVTTTLSRDAGLDMWGYPKTVEDLTWHRSGGRATMTWRSGDTEVFRFSAPATGSRTPAAMSPEVYSVFDGAPHVGNLTQAYAGTGYHRTGGELSLGDHWIADELKELGLPKQPVVSIWNDKLAFQMSAPRPL